MGAGLAKTAAVRFARLSGNEYKVLMHMCLVALDKPNGKPSKLWPDGHPAALWYASWEDLALAIGSQIPDDSARRGNLRRDIRDLCRELENTGAIEARPHPMHDGMKAYHLALTPDERWAKLAHAKRARRGANNPTGRGPNRPTSDTKTGAKLPPSRGPNWPPPSTGEREEDFHEDLPEDPTQPVGDQPPVDVGNVADISHRDQLKAAARAALRGEQTDDEPTPEDAPPDDAPPTDHIGSAPPADPAYLAAVLADEPPDLEDLEPPHEAAS